MLMIDNKVISLDILKVNFACNLNKCKGLCCKEGDVGAPLELEELEILDSIIDDVLPYLSKKAQSILTKKGAYVDFKGEFVTNLIGRSDCVFAMVDKHGVYKCAIEQAFLDGKIGFHKPISCHLYPIRVTKSNDNYLLNYDIWDICSSALCNGENKKIPLLKFLKEPIIKKFGEDFYEKLEVAYMEFNK